MFDSSIMHDVVNIVDFCKTLLSNVVCLCPECGCKSITTELGKRCGWAVQIVIACGECGYVSKFGNSPKLSVPSRDGGGNQEVYEVNLRMVYGMRCIGKGMTAAEEFAGVMNLPKPPKFSKYESILRVATEKVCSESMDSAKEEAVAQNSGDRDIVAAFDGSWQKRGHTSLNGVISATSPYNSKIIDIEVLSKFCRCPEKLRGIHKGNCYANYSGTSGGMEAEGIKRIYERSKTRNVRYMYYLGDGDSSAYKSIVDLQPYGPSEKVQKLECIGHMQKRMGTRLRNLKILNAKKKLSDNKPLGGRGRLTDVAVDKIQTFYGLAIRRNTNGTLEAMKRDVWATYFHLSSSNSKLSHGLCPDGAESWCKYKKNIANGESYDHNAHFHLPGAVCEVMKPIFL